MTKTVDPKTQVELEAAACRRLVEHLRTRSDVQNIDLMNLAGFCRNCLANWMQEAAGAQGQHHEAELADGGVGDDLLDVGHHDGHTCAHQGGDGADGGISTEHDGARIREAKCIGRQRLTVYPRPRQGQS